MKELQGSNEPPGITQYSICRAVIHNLKVTTANPYCDGSIVVDRLLMDKVGFYEGEEVLVTNVEKGGRAVTYIVPAPAGSGIVETSGSMSKFAQPDDLVCVMAFVKTDRPDLVSRADLNLKGNNNV